jgi:hypothetical protein
MKNSRSSFFIWIVMGLLATFFILGCEDEEPTGGNPPEPVPANIFPLTPGNVLVYNSGTLLELDSDLPIAGTEVGYQSQWVIIGQIPVDLTYHHIPTLL